MTILLLPLIIVFLPLGFDPILTDTDPQLYRVTKNGKYGFIDSTGALVIEANYDNAGSFCNGLAPINVGGKPYGHHFRGGKWGFLDKKGKIIIQPQFDYAADFKEGLAAVAFISDSSNDDLPVLKWGYVNVNGQLVVLPKYSQVGKFHNGFASVNLDGKWGAVNARGQLVVSPNYRQDFQFTFGRAWVQCDNYGWGIIDTSGTVLRPCNLSLKYIQGFYEGLSVVCSKDNHWLVVDLNGTLVLDLNYEWVTEFHHGLARVTDQGKSIFIDHTGKIIKRTIYDWTGDESMGLVLVKKDEKYGFADELNWEIVIPLKYSDAEPFHSGFAAVQLKENERYGFITPDGKEAFQKTFTRVGKFEGPLCWVMLDCENDRVPCDRSGYINKRGVVVWIDK